MASSSPFSKHSANIPQLKEYGRNSSDFVSNTQTMVQSSSFHQTCVPKETKDRIKSAPARTKKNVDYELCNKVTEEMKWSERCRKERMLQNHWEKNCGFLTTYDQYGNKRPTRVVSSESLSLYSSRTRPLTASMEYGHRVSTPPAKTMQYYQLKMSRGMKRDKDLLVSD